MAGVCTARAPLFISVALAGGAARSGAKFPARRSTPGKPLLDVILLLCRRANFSRRTII